MTLFELVAKLTLDTSEFDTEVTGATKKGGELGTSLEGVISKSVALGNAMYDMARKSMSALGEFAVDLVETAAAFQAEENTFYTVFGENAAAAVSMIEELSGENDIYFTRMRSAATSFFTQFKAGGLDDATALQYMYEALALSADGAAFYDLTLEDASYRLRSFLRGNVEAGEAIGLFSNSVSREAKAAELYGAAWKELNEAQRETVLLMIAMDSYQATGAVGQASREAENYANQLGNLKAIWTDIKATLGGPILEAVIPVLKQFQEFLTSNPEFIQGLADALGQLASFISDGLIGMLETLEENPLIGATVLSTIMSLVDALVSIASALAPVGEVLFNALIDSLVAVLKLIEPVLSALEWPIKVVASVIETIASALSWLTGKRDPVTQATLDQQAKDIDRLSYGGYQAVLDAFSTLSNASVYQMEHKDQGEYVSGKAGTLAGLSEDTMYLMDELWDDYRDNKEFAYSYTQAQADDDIFDALWDALYRDYSGQGYEDALAGQEANRMLEQLLRNMSYLSISSEDLPSEWFGTDEYGGGGGGGSKPKSTTEDVVTELETVKTELQGLRSDLISAVQSMANRPISLSVDGQEITTIVNRNTARKARTTYF